MYRTSTDIALTNDDAILSRMAQVTHKMRMREIKSKKETKEVNTFLLSYYAL